MELTSSPLRLSATICILAANFSHSDLKSVSFQFVTNSIFYHLSIIFYTVWLCAVEGQHTGTAEPQPGRRHIKLPSTVGIVPRGSISWDPTSAKMCRCCLHCTYLRFRLMYCALKFCASIHSQLLTEMVKTGYLFALLARSFLEPTHLIGALRMFFDHSHTTRDYVRVRCIDDLVNDSDLLQTVFPTQNTGSYFSACKASLIDSSRRRLVKLDVNLLGNWESNCF